MICLTFCLAHREWAEIEQKRKEGVSERASELSGARLRLQTQVGPFPGLGCPSPAWELKSEPWGALIL